MRYVKTTQTSIIDRACVPLSFMSDGCNHHREARDVSAVVTAFVTAVATVFKPLVTTVTAFSMLVIIVGRTTNATKSNTTLTRRR